MTHPNRHDLRKRTDSGILSNVLSFVSREIGEFVVSATGGAGESDPSKRKHRRDGKLQQERKREGEERGRQRRGYDGSMIEQWRGVSGGDGGDKKHMERAKNRRKSSADRGGHSRREKEQNSRDGKRYASPNSLSRSPSGEHCFSHAHSQSQESSHSHVVKTKPKPSSDGKLSSKSADSYGRKKARGHEYEDQPGDADGELTPTTSPSPGRNNHSREGKVRQGLQEITTRRSPSHSPQRDPSSSRTNPPPLSNMASTSSLLTARQVSRQAVYPSLRKKPSVTMPGSLFPRSDSLEPEEEKDNTSLSDERNTNPIRHSPDSGARESEPGPSGYCDATPADEIGPSPWRTRPITSVHDALERFDASGGEERDFSLLVVASPAGNIHPASRGTVQEKSHLPSASRKGKERAIVVDDDEDLAFILDQHHVQDKEKQLDAARRETGTKSQTTDDAERERDKERIRVLEEEVRTLKEELSRRHRSPPPPPQTQTQTQVPIPPPPPPLPPPPAVRIPLPPHLGETGDLFASARAALRSTEASSAVTPPDTARKTGGKMRQPTVNVPSEKMAAFLNEMRTVRLRKVGSVQGGLDRSVSDQTASNDCSGPSGLSRSVSTAGLDRRREVEIARRKSMSARMPIGSASTSKLGVSKPISGSAPSEPMSGSNGFSRQGTGSQSTSTSKLPTVSSIPRPTSTSVASKSSASALAPTSSNSTYPRVSKRKVDALGETEGGAASKRRPSTRTQVQSDSSISSSSTTHESSSSTHLNFLAGSSLQNHSSLSNGTDITTPSLCSDNELGDADARMPSTPPGPRRPAAQSSHDSVEIIDVDMDEPQLPHRPITPSHPQRNSFKKRPPMSPLPVPTPRRPPAPARAKGKKSISTPERTKRGATPRPKGILLLDEDDDDTEEEEFEYPPRLQWKRETQARDADVDRPVNDAKGKRRLTLDEELARARSSDLLAELDMESQELVGMGTGSTRRGFLAGGGAGGAPVFMGVGYVRGAEGDSLRQPASRIPRRRG